MVMLFKKNNGTITNPTVLPVQEYNNDNYDLNQIQKNVNKSLNSVSGALGNLSNSFCYVGLSSSAGTYVQSPNSVLIINEPISDMFNCFDKKNSAFISPVDGLIMFSFNLSLVLSITAAKLTANVNGTTSPIIIYNNPSTSNIFNIITTWYYIASKGDSIVFYYEGLNSPQILSKSCQLVMTWR